MLKQRYSATFFVSEPNPQGKAWDDFIEIYLHYTRNFDYGGMDLNTVLALPYSLYKDVILKQVKLKKQEEKEKARIRQQEKSKRSNIKRR